jgi:polar amino acid transport system substrate-binding protein
MREHLNRGMQAPMLSTARLELTPTGRMRVGINFGNTVLANKDANGTPTGIAVDLAKELERRLGVFIDLITYDAAGRMADGARQGAWDIAFLAADPDRAKEITFTAPYLEIDSTYLVPAESPFWTPAEVDRDGTRIAVSAKSAYDLFLNRNLKHARLVRAPGPNASVELFFREKLDALSGIRPMLIDIAEQHRGTRVLDERFTTVQQAIGTPRGRDAAAQYLNGFVEDVIASGFVAKTVEKNGILGVSVAPLTHE